MDPDMLVLGPLLRATDETTSCVWVELARPCTVEVRYGDRRAEASSFAVHGHHYALVDLDGLEPGSRTAYAVWAGEERLWPPPDSPFPEPAIHTWDPARGPRLLYGSCRTAVPHDADGTRSHGVDALRTYALRLAGLAPPAAGDEDALADREALWPDLMLFLGDQVYADETTDAMREFIESRRDPDEPPGWELKDYEEYAHLYRLAWSDPAVRWLLSTVPSAMIFDDHDVRDDWNTSHDWRTEMEATSWWHDRIVAGLCSYWVYQHLGNMSREQRSDDEIWRVLRDGTAPAGEGDAGAPDLTECLDAFAERVDRSPETYRWSYARSLPNGVRLVVVDSRAARVLEPSRRAMLDSGELDWLDRQMRGDVDHLLVATSIPFLLARGLHHVESFSEALAGGAWGRAGAGIGERLRRLVDLEHWAAFHESFDAVARMALEVASGRRGRPPATVAFLSGDVHHSYVSRAWEAGTRRRSRSGSTQILQAVCSPIRNPLPRQMRYATAVASIGIAGPAGRLLSRLSKVPDGPLRWRFQGRPWFDNNISLVEPDGRSLRMRWFTGDVVDEDYDRPRLRTVADHRA